MAAKPPSFNPKTCSTSQHTLLPSPSTPTATTRPQPTSHPLPLYSSLAPSPAHPLLRFHARLSQQYPQSWPMSPQSTSGAVSFPEQKSTHHIPPLQHTADLHPLACSQGTLHCHKLASLPHYHAHASHRASPSTFNPLHHGSPTPHTSSPSRPPSSRVTKHPYFPSMPSS